MRSLLGAFLLVMAAVALRHLSPSVISREISERLFGALMGAMVIAYSNAVPKALTPLARLQCDPAVEQSRRRFAGWTLALGGAANMAAWLLVPIEHASGVATGCLGIALLVVIARCVRPPKE